MRVFGAARVFDGAGGGGAAGGPFLPLDGSTPMTGDIDMGGFSITNQTSTFATTAVSATTASLGAVDRFIATAENTTITISSADIAVDGRRFIFAARSTLVTAGSPVTIATEAAETIDGAASVDLVFDHDSITLIARAGNLETP